MRTKEDIVHNCLPRYTDKPLKDFGISKQKREELVSRLDHGYFARTEMGSLHCNKVLHEVGLLACAEPVEVLSVLGIMMKLWGICLWRRGSSSNS